MGIERGRPVCYIIETACWIMKSRDDDPGSPGTEESIMSTRHVVLLGDSTFDNAAYTDGGPDVASQLRQRLGDRVTLLAVDGAVTWDVPRQLEGLPEDATHLALSVGGNDALMRQSILGARVRRMDRALNTMMDVIDEFEASYRSALEAVVEACRPSGGVDSSRRGIEPSAEAGANPAGTGLTNANRGLPLVVCTIYGGAFPTDMQRLVDAALRMFNDSIFQAAFDVGAPVIDLRRICNEPSDYVLEIEPNEAGGAKIANAVAAAVEAESWERSWVHPSGVDRN
jgi:hypothetical protein